MLYTYYKSRISHSGLNCSLNATQQCRRPECQDCGRCPPEKAALEVFDCGMGVPFTSGRLTVRPYLAGSMLIYWSVNHVFFIRFYIRNQPFWMGVPPFQETPKWPLFFSWSYGYDNIPSGFHSPGFNPATSGVF